MGRLELWEDNLHQELLHLLLVHRLLQQDVRHGADHVQRSIFLARSGASCLDDGQQHVHRLLQHLLPLLTRGVKQSLSSGDWRHKVLENDI